LYSERLSREPSMRRFLAAVTLSTIMAPQLPAQNPARKPPGPVVMVRGDSLVMLIVAAERLRATQPQYRPKQVGDSAPPLPYPKRVRFYGDSGYVTFALSQTRWIRYGLDKKDGVWVVRAKTSVVEPPAVDTAAGVALPPPPKVVSPPTSRSWEAAVPVQSPRPIPKESILRVDTLRAATRGPDGMCNYDQKAVRALTPKPGSGTRLLPMHVDPVACRIIVVTVDSAKFMEATKQAKPDTGSVQVFRSNDTAAMLWMRDTVSKDLAGRYPGIVIGYPWLKGDTAWVRASRFENGGLYEFTTDYRFERRGRWVLSDSRGPWYGRITRRRSDTKFQVDSTKDSTARRP
jgi:hypothetical protein